MKKWIIPALATLLCAGAYGTFAASNTDNVVKIHVSQQSKISVVSKAAQSTNHTGISVKKAPSADNIMPFSLPMSIVPNYNDFERIIVDNANNDNKTWDNQSLSLHYGYDYNNAANDWAYIPVTLTDENSTLTLSFEFKAAYSGDKEDMDVYFGQEMAPAKMTQILDLQQINHTQYKEYSTIFQATGTGTHFLAFHAKSAAYMSGMFVKNIKLAAASAPAPQAPVIVSSSINELEYTATVALPSKNIIDETIDGTVGLSVLVDGVEVQNHPDLTPGADKDIALTLEKGQHTISYIAYLGSGDKAVAGEAATENVKAVSSAPLTLPVYIAPTAEDNDACQTANVNDDDGEWKFDTSTSYPAFSYTYGNKDADDWLFLPIVNFGETGGSFDFSLDANVQYSTYPETFEVCVGREAKPEAMTQNIMTCSKITNRFAETYSESFSLAEGGNWYIGIHVTTPTADGYVLTIRNINIKKAADKTPAAPEFSAIDFAGVSGTVTVRMPLSTVDGNPLPDNIGLVVNVDNQEYKRYPSLTPGSEQVVDLELALGEHVVNAAAYVADGANELVGVPASTTIVARHSADYVYPLPFYMRPTKDEFAEFTQTIGNEAAQPWDYNTGADNGQGAMICRTKGDADNDAWVFLPKFAVDDASRIYNVSIRARAYLEQYPEDFDICIGTEAAPDAMNVVLSKRGVTSYLYVPYTTEWIAPEAGNYVLAIHRLSKGATSHTLSVNDIRVEDAGMSVYAPEACSVDGYTPAADGEAKVTVSFTMPVKNIAGGNLEADDMLTAAIVGADNQTATVTGAPGSKQTLTVAAKDGYSTMTLTVTSAKYGLGRSTDCEVFCGIDKPSDPSVVVTPTEDNMKVTITWQDSDQGANGGYVNTALLTHTIYVPVDESGENWSLVAEIPAGTSSYVMECQKLQDITIVGVTASNDKGQSQLGWSYAVTGTPYSLPMEENLSDGKYSYNPVMSAYPTDEYAQWFTDKPGLIFTGLNGSDEMALMTINDATDSNIRYAHVILPKFTSTVDPGTQVCAEFTVYNSDRSAPATVYASTWGTDDVKIGELPATADTEGWHTYKFTLPDELTNKAWVNFNIKVDFKTGVPSAFALQKYNFIGNIPSGVSQITDTDDVLVTPAPGGVTITGADGNTVSIYTPDGKLVASRTLSGNSACITLASGVYIVKTAKTVSRIAVR